MVFDDIIENINSLERNNLKTTYQISKKEEKVHGKAILYFVWESDELIYIGTGGRDTNHTNKGKRPGSGRLYEHLCTTWTNFRSDYERLKGEEDPTYTIIQRQKDWDNLKWSFICFNKIDDAKKFESILINLFNPFYNKNIPKLCLEDVTNLSCTIHRKVKNGFEQFT